VGTVSFDKTSVDFGEIRAGTRDLEGGVAIRATFGGDAPVTVSKVDVEGGDFADFPGGTNCLNEDGTAKTFSDGDTCETVLFFAPITHGDRSSTLQMTSTASGSPHSIPLMGTGTSGYYVAGTLGQVAAFGDAIDFGDMSEVTLNAPVVGITTTQNGDGYWLTGRDGGIFSFGNAEFLGSMGGQRLNQPIVGMATWPDPNADQDPTTTLFGYYQVASDGGIFAWGNAGFHGSTGGIRLNQPIVGMAVHPSGEGYWLVARDGGVFAFGDAEFHGSMGGSRLNQPVVGMAPTPSGEGYWLVARDGGIFSFGDADFHGSTGAIRLNSPIVDMASAPLGDGYWLIAGDGGIFAFDVPFHGSLPDAGVTGVTDVIGIAPTAPPVDISGTVLESSSVRAASVGLSGPSGRVARSSS